MSERRNIILDLWAEGLSSGLIADRMSCARGYVCNVILRARDSGDHRAKQRRRSRYS